ncbi:NADP-dependent oxidoreductase [Roseateles chitinivorans]|uniref:NADP-dependent oxidoreductase n=1 Tax=Roseateles chitinivorans TaxID=2917965 RepID=A0A2G9C1Z1_9BURK|nr:NADP-dependent oxidoreductase [Roseateles chitinivorans]PIM50441.1 NADP-dependent oxidoreductase [Roseateles chitinivorans]
MTTPVNRRIVLAARPAGRPLPGDFRLETVAVPSVGAGQVLLRTLYLSLDPYMRNLMEEIGPGYAPPLALGEVLVGGTVSRVVESRHPDFRAGELVLAHAGWQDYALSDGQDLVPLGDVGRPSLALGAAGMPGFTAQVGLAEIGRPRAGETVVVGAATGAVGAMVGQLARRAGARVVGIAGGADKVRHLVETFGFDAAVDRRDPRFAERLREAAPAGIDVYFESVGGEVLDAVLPLLNIGARVPVSGFIAHYNEAGAEGDAAAPDRRPALLATLLQKRVRMEGFIVLDHYGDGLSRFKAFQREMTAAIAAGEVRALEHVVDGLERAPQGLIDLLDGRHLGKVVVAVAAP